MRRILTLCCLLVCLTATVSAAANDDPVYRPANVYPLLDEMVAARAAMQAVQDSLKQLVDDRYAAEEAAAEDGERTLRVDLSGITIPDGPDAFGESPFYFPPLPQYYTGTCWAFCSTSLLESEVARISGKQIKLSEMFTVYWAYVEKAKRFVREYGHSVVAQGGQDGDTLEMMRLYGAVPAAAYAGILNPDGRFDHTPLSDEIKGYLEWVEENCYWNEAIVTANVRAILDAHMGPPPESFNFEGAGYTPKTFLSDVLELNPDDYVSCVSTLRQPFYGYGVLDVVDNWRREDTYFNLPLGDFYKVLKESVKAGYTVSIGGDNSEPGMDGYNDCGVIPSFDIPSKYIDQGARELRIENGTTTDDHGLHAVDYLRLGGRDWYLIKDSNRSSRLGEYKGYYFWTGDYIKLKILAIMVHRDRLDGLLP